MVYKYEFSVDVVNVILKALGELPAKETGILMVAIQNSAKAQEDAESKNKVINDEKASD